MLNSSSPTRTESGTFVRNRFAAFSAAARRVGATSVAAIEPLVSLASMIDAVSIGTATVRAGRAAAMIRTASATANASIGTCRRQRGRRGDTDALSAGDANAAAALTRPRCWLKYHLISNGIANSAIRNAGSRKLMDSRGPGGERDVLRVARPAPWYWIPSWSPGCLRAIAEVMSDGADTGDR